MAIKRGCILLITIMAILSFTGVTSAALTKIGTANYLGSDYNLIYEDTKGLVWMDYVRELNTWQNQVDWASGLGAALVVIIDPGFTTTVDWNTGWRLPSTDESKATMSGGLGYEGPDLGGYYDYLYGYNMVNSEMGHLYYESLGNQGYLATDGNPQTGWGLKNKGPFNNLDAFAYWSGTEYSPMTTIAWYFDYSNAYSQDNQLYVNGILDGDPKADVNHYALAVRTGEVSAVPVPGTMLLLASGLAGICACRKMNRRRCR